MAERLFFQSAVEGLLATLPALTPDVRKRLLALGVDPDALLPAYPQDVYIALTAYVGEVLFPSLPVREREAETGAAFLRSFSKSLVGAATLGLARVVGPHRAIARLTRSLRTANNFAEGGTSSSDEKVIGVWIQPVVRPHLYLGVLREAGRLIGTRNSQVELTRYENERAEYRFWWE
jgi:uncharacterized protein (TIGR02265 family)